MHKWRLILVALLIPVILFVLVFAACRPPTPVPTPIQTPAALSGVVHWMHPDDAALLAGLWPEGVFGEHNFPRIYAAWLRWGDWSSGRDVAAAFHIVELQCGARGDTTTTPSPICEYLKDVNSDLKLFVYMPASFEYTNWNDWISWGDRYSCRGFHGSAIDTGGHWLYESDGTIVDMTYAGHTGAAATNCSQFVAYRDWYGDYLAGNYVFNDATCDWDGIRLDVAGYHKRQLNYPSTVDQDENNIGDQSEHGIPWINNEFTTGANTYMADFLTLQPGGLIGGNAMWRHKSMDYAENPFSEGGSATIAMNEWFPWNAMYEDWYSNGCFARTCDWACQMEQYVDWIDTVGSDATWVSLGCDYDFSRGQYRAMRFGLGSTMLDDGYFGYQYDCLAGYSNIEKYDEYWVNNVTFNIARPDGELDHLGYCGQPIGPAYSLNDGETLRTKISDGDDLDAVCWYRQFDNCLVLTNPTGSTCNFTGLGTSWRHFWGGQDPAINDGSLVVDSETVASEDAEILLFRTGEPTPTPTAGNTPTPTPTNTATITPTATSTPTDTPTPTVTPTCVADWLADAEAASFWPWDDVCMTVTDTQIYVGGPVPACAGDWEWWHWSTYTDTMDAYLSHDVPAKDTGDWESCVRFEDDVGEDHTFMRAVAVAGSYPCTQTLSSVWELYRNSSNNVFWTCDVCSPVPYHYVGTQANDVWATWRVDWSLPVNPGTGAVTIYKDATPVFDTVGIGMQAAPTFTQTEALQVGIMQWPGATAPAAREMYSDENYDYENTVTCTPTSTSTPTPTATSTITPTNTPTPTITSTATPTATGATPTPTRTPFATSTPTPHGTPVIVLRESDSFLCECECLDGTPTLTPTATATATPDGEWFACWETSNEQWNPEYNDFGDWDGRALIDDRVGGGGAWISSITLVSTPAPYDGTYSYEHRGDTPDSACTADTWIRCPEEKSVGWFSGHVMWESLPGIGVLSYPFWTARGELESGDSVPRILTLYTDSADGDKVKLACGAAAGCDALHVWTCSDVAPTPGQWYEYAVYWELPFNTPNGRVDCWWDGAQTVHDGAVQTETDPAWWSGYQYIESGIWNHHFNWGCASNQRYWTDDLWDCGCKVVGVVTPTPWPTPTST